MRRAVALLTSTTVTALFLVAGTAQATKPFDGPEAGGATLAAGILTGFVCWTIELAEGESYDDEGFEEVDDDFDRAGWFVGLQGVYAHENIDESKEQDNVNESNLPFLVDFQMSTSEVGGVRGKIGRRCNSRLSIELQVEWLDSFKASVDEAETGRTNDITFDSMVGSIDVKGYLLTGRLQPFGVVGVGVTRADTNVSGSGAGFAARFGAGADYWLNDHFSVGATYSYVVKSGAGVASRVESPGDEVAPLEAGARALRHASGPRPRRQGSLRLVDVGWRPSTIR